MRRAPASLIFLALVAAPASGAAAGRHLTFEARVAAQEAIERVQYSHLQSASRPFEEVFTSEVLEDRVRIYLKQSSALEDFWQTPITADALSRELERIARRTRFPERLQEIYTSLGNDAFLIEECFARAVLVNRLARSFFGKDDRLHAASRKQADDLRELLIRGETDDPSLEAGRHVLDVTMRDAASEAPGDVASADPGGIDLGQEAFERWRAELPDRIGEVGPIVEEPHRFVFSVILSEEPGRARVATYAVTKVTWDEWWPAQGDRWRDTLVPEVSEAVGSPPQPAGPAATSLQGGAAPAPPGSPCSLEPAWDNGILDDLPEPRGEHTAVWTGIEMIVWGGHGAVALDTGSRYDPVTDSWTSMSRLSAPSPRWAHSAVWTGSVMLVWGGIGIKKDLVALNTGGIYDPATDSWSPIKTANAPSKRFLHTAVWTGSEMVIWGGTNGRLVLRNGARFNPVKNSWSAVASKSNPSYRFGHTAVWTGSRMIVWGGYAAGPGASYDPIGNRWTAISGLGQPAARYLHTAVWTGSEMIIWGGAIAGTEYTNSGGRYDPVSDSWASMSIGGAPEARAEHAAVWTGDRMLVHGGHASGPISGFHSGAQYDPASDSWIPMSTLGAPSPRWLPSVIWSGSHLIVWGGGPGLNTGARYDPGSDSWTPTSMLLAPSARQDQHAFWTGIHMVIWGTDGSSVSPRDGGRYDPLTDEWLPMSMVEAPTARFVPMIWTGQYLVAWGGQDSHSHSLDTGSFYDPILDRWWAISRIGAPSARHGHVLTWVGGSAVVWGGSSNSTPLGDGARYDPASDTWSPVTSVNAPSARRFPGSVVAGDRLVIWGGDTGHQVSLNSGGFYDVAADRWTPMTIQGAPAGRSRSSVVWTGSELLIWGGAGTAGIFNDGALYDPLHDRWRAISQASAPTPRYGHTTLWTGSSALIWGGFGSGASGASGIQQAGGRFDPVADSWRPISRAGAPGAYAGQTAIWTGRFMIVWGGQVSFSPEAYSGSGGAYDPAQDRWQPTPSAGPPSPRRGHSAVWTGREMILFGGSNGTTLGDGGRLGIIGGLDQDGDGLTSCTGDCDDSSPAVYASAPQICGDGLNNDCNHVHWPQLTVTNELDDDTDGLAECDGDCDDNSAMTWPGAPEVCDLADNSCDGAADEGFDLDGDHATSCGGDCDDARATVFAAAPQLCDGLNNDCAHPVWPSLAQTNETDQDGDAFSECAGDCDDTNSTTHPGAPEINDGEDNQCPGDTGFGVVDELSPETGFPSGSAPESLCWVPQQSANGYLVVRAEDAQFLSGCKRYYATSTCREDSQIPVPGRAYYYLVRPEGPSRGGWGHDSRGISRPDVCSLVTYTLSFQDHFTSDISSVGLRNFFYLAAPAPTDYIYFGITRGGLLAGAWCSQRADFYSDTYLQLAESGGEVWSEYGLKWYRTADTEPWVTGYGGSPNIYGDSCLHPWSWCSETHLLPNYLAINPAAETTCEAYIQDVGCGGPGWELTIRISQTREAACGF